MEEEEEEEMIAATVLDDFDVMRGVVSTVCVLFSVTVM